MNKEIVKMSDLTEKVRDRVKDIFAELIPEEAWQNLVETEIKNFREKILPSIINEELKKMYKAKIKEELFKSDYVQKYDPNGKLVPGEQIKRMLGELAPSFVTALFEGVADNVICRIRNEMSSGY